MKAHSGPSERAATSALVKEAAPLPTRLVSLDAFRGLTIAAMMLVNNPGTWSAVYPPLRHAEWHGWTFTDTVFPFFLWIVGVALTLSLGKRLERGPDNGRLVFHIVRRAVIIFALGMFLSGFPYFAWDHIRIPGVLQRIALCYLVAAVLFLYTKWRGQIAAIVILLTSYWVLMMLYPVPGVGAGHLEKDANFARYVDSLFLTGHMWSQTKVWDPEGIVSTLPAIATTLFGVMLGHLLRLKVEQKQKIVWMLGSGAALLALGQILNLWMPINKNLWTTSFSVFMAGLATIEFAILYWLIDVKGYKAWAKPFVIYGMNAIAVYVLAGFLGRMLGLIKVSGDNGTAISLGTFLYQNYFAPLASPLNASLLYALAWVVLMFLVSWFLYWRRWFLRV